MCNLTNLYNDIHTWMWSFFATKTSVIVSCPNTIIHKNKAVMTQTHYKIYSWIFHSFFFYLHFIYSSVLASKLSLLIFLIVWQVFVRVSTSITLEYTWHYSHNNVKAADSINVVIPKPLHLNLSLYSLINVSDVYT